MNTTQSPTSRSLTEAEISRLQRLQARLENARDFSASSRALDAMNAYEQRLMRAGVTTDAILAATGR